MTAGCQSRWSRALVGLGDHADERAAFAIVEGDAIAHREPRGGGARGRGSYGLEVSPGFASAASIDT